MKKINFRQIKKFTVNHVLLLVLIIIVCIFAYYYFNGTSFRENAEPNTSCSQVNGDGTLEVSSSNNITEITEHQYRDCSNIICVKIPNNITKIGNNAFRKCTNLKYIEIEPNSTLKEIGDDAFAECENLECIFLPNSLQTIRDRAFPLTKNGFKVYLEVYSEVNNEVNEVGQIDFYIMNNFVNFFDLPSANDIKKVFGPPIIFVSPFALEKLTEKYRNDKNKLPLINKYVKGIAKTDYDKAKERNKTNMIGKEVYSKEISVKINPNCKDIINGTLKIPENTLEIEDRKYAGCNNLTRVAIKKNLTTISNNAFENCKNLKYIDFEPGSMLTKIGENAFKECNQLECIFFPTSLYEFGKGAFPSVNKNLKLYLDNNYTQTNAFVFEKKISNFFDTENPTKNSPTLCVDSSIYAQIKDQYKNDNERNSYLEFMKPITQVEYNKAKNDNDANMKRLIVESDYVTLNKTDVKTIDVNTIDSIELNDILMNRLPKDCNNSLKSTIYGNEIKNIKLK